MNNDTARWVIGGVLASALTWSTWVTTAVWEDRARLARIETKIDILVDKVLKTDR